jgi:hypothetical protein
MDKKQKIRVVVIFPLMAVLLILGGMIFFVLQAGSSVATGAAEDHAAAGAAATEAAVIETAAEPSCAFDFMIGMSGEQALENIKPLDRPYRIMGPNDAMTMDHNPMRINVITDEETGVVTSVSCG